MKGKGRSFVTLLGLLVLAVWVMGAKVTITQFTKQNGGSSGDSCTVLPDTSDYLRVDEDADEVYIIVMSDTAHAYSAYVSADSSHWMNVVALDSVTAGAAEMTSDIGKAYNTMYIRAIIDNLEAAGCSFGRSYLVTVED